jgi:hypothetical protein
MPLGDSIERVGSRRLLRRNDKKGIRWCKEDFIRAAVTLRLL